MYAAYQSHQSWGGAAASNAPWRSDVSCSRSDSEAMSMSVLPFPAGEPGRDFLKQPAVAVRVAERRVYEVRAPFDRLEARGARLVRLADVGAPADQVVPGRLDVLDREDHPLSRPGLSLREALAEVDRALRLGRGELHPTDLLAGPEVGVQPPSEA